MPETAKRFGLSLWPRDQHFQPQPSATASAQYLKYLYGRFKDWRLAVAAYNCGEGTVQRLLDKYKAHSYDAIARHLPAETQMYVPRVEAVIRERENVNLEQLSVPTATIDGIDDGCFRGNLVQFLGLNPTLNFAQRKMLFAML